MEELIPNLRDRQVQGAVKNLVIYSLTIIAVPLASMFILKAYLFQGLLSFNAEDSILYAAISAVVLVHVVLGFWVFSATGEDKPKTIKKD